MRFFVLFLFILPGTAFASQATAPEERKFSLLDSAQNLFTSRINQVANRVDAFFATERADDEFSRSTFRVTSAYNVRERASGELNTRYRINLRLPHLEEKFRYRYYKKSKDSGKVETEKEKRRSEVNKGWLFNADAGVSAAISPKLITRARLRRNFQTGIFIHRFVEQLTYITDESGLQEETAINSDFSIEKDLLFRFNNSKRWQIFKKQFTTAHGPSFIQTLTENTAVNYSLIMSSVINEGVWYATSYNFSIDYRHNLYKQWLYLDLIPGLDFPKQWSFRRTPYFVIQIEALFGG